MGLGLIEIALNVFRLFASVIPSSPATVISDHFGTPEKAKSTAAQLVSAIMTR